MPPEFDSRFLEFINWLPRSVSSLLAGVAWGIVMAPLWVLLAGPRNVRYALIITALGALGFTVFFYWGRVQYGDFKGPGRRELRRRQRPPA